ncbi:MAG: TldD/PmbA family protein [Candidatus Sericytochromatia bacterium]|nr:TldD/PmbA family protein [Candidatus Sericytochromatia bacterium]
MKELTRPAPFELSRDLVEQVLERALSRGADFAEIFAEDKTYSGIQFLDQKVKSCVSGQDFGAGVRVLYGTDAVYAYTSDLSLAGLLSLAEQVASAQTGIGRAARAEWRPVTPPVRHTLTVHPDDVPKTEKVAMMRRADAAARAFSKEIEQVEVSLASEYQRVFIANSEGLWTSEDRPYIRLMINAIATDGQQKQSGRESPGALAGWEWVEAQNVEELARSAAHTAVTMLHAPYAPSGKMPVVIENAFGGVIFHEACGHLLETTSVAKGASIFAGKLGEQIAHPCVTAIDDGTMDGEWGSLAIDDEGMPTQRTVLIENGILKSYMVDRVGALKTGYQPTGSGRRQSYRFAPTSRMRNTFIAPGHDTIYDMIGSIDYGLYAKKMGGGSVSPGTGDFNFAVLEGYMIRDGRIAEPVRGATLVGNGGDILQKIVMVGDNFAMAAGKCGSVSGSISTNVGQPAIKVSEIVVGGRA